MTERMATMERNQPGYYYTERSSNYQGPPPFDPYRDPYRGPPPPLEKEVYVDYHKPRMGPCMTVLAIIFILFIIILVICLIIFFTWGAAYRPNPNGTTGKQSSEGGVSYADELEEPKHLLNSLKRGSPKTCILDTAFLVPNYAQRYSEEHIPGARHFDINKVTKRLSDGSYQVAHPLEFQTYVRSLGIDKDCQVIVYDHSETSNSIVTATYVWSLFKLFGQPRVSVLNGGLKEWKKYVNSVNEPSYQAVNSPSKAPKDGDFEAVWNPRYVVSYSDVEDAVKKGKTQIVDSRSPDFDKGTNKDKDAKEGGRIKGSINAPDEEMLTNDGALKILPDLKKWMASKNIETNRPTIVYDNTAMDASALYFVMIQAGFPDVSLYDGGWIEYSYKAPKDLKEVVTSG